MVTRTRARTSRSAPRRAPAFIKEAEPNGNLADHDSPAQPKPEEEAARLPAGASNVAREARAEILHARVYMRGNWKGGGMTENRGPEIALDGRLVPIPPTRSWYSYHCGICSALVETEITYADDLFSVLRQQVCGSCKGKEIAE